MKKYQGLLLGHLGNEPEQYYIDSLYGFLIAVKGEVTMCTPTSDGSRPILSLPKPADRDHIQRGEARLELAKQGV